MAWYSAVLGLGRSLADRDGIDDLSKSALRGAAPSSSINPILNKAVWSPRLAGMAFAPLLWSVNIRRVHGWSGEAGGGAGGRGDGAVGRRRACREGDGYAAGGVAGHHSQYRSLL